MVRRTSRGFTLVEMLVASAIAGVAVAAAFSFATFQIRGYSEQQDTQELSTSSRALLETVIDDVRVAGLGTSFYAGVGAATVFGGRAAVSDASGPLGVPAISITDQVNGPINATPGLGVMAGSDAITLLRVEGEATFLPSSGAGNVGMPAAPGANVPFTVMNQAALIPCATGNGSRLVLVSDMVRQGEPASGLYELDGNVPGWGAAAADGSGPIRFALGDYGINPAAPGDPDGLLPPGRVFGPGSVVTCVRLVTYWLDNIGRVRMWLGTAANVLSASGIIGSWPLGQQRPINPANDAVIADNVRMLQFAAFMSDIAPSFPGNWALNAPPLASSRPGDPGHMVETRAIRMSALLATPRAGEARIRNVPATIANHTLIAANYPGTHTYRLATYSAEVRNLRHFDLMSSAARPWNLVRSYPQ